MEATSSVMLCGISLFFLGQGSEWFWVMVESIIVIVSLWFIYRQVKLSRYANMLQTILKFREMWSSQEMMRCRQSTCENYQRRTEAIGKVEEEVSGFFEEIGLLVEKHVIPKEFVWECYSYYIEPYWTMMKKNIKKFRQQTHDESWLEHFERLRETMRKFSKKRNVPSRDLTAAKIEQFIKGELERIG